MDEYSPCSSMMCRLVFSHRNSTSVGLFFSIACWVGLSLGCAAEVYGGQTNQTLNAEEAIIYSLFNIDIVDVGFYLLDFCRVWFFVSMETARKSFGELFFFLVFLLMFFSSSSSSYFLLFGGCVPLLFLSPEKRHRFILTLVTWCSSRENDMGCLQLIWFIAYHALCITVNI